jgi:subtilisin family serine protease
MRRACLALSAWLVAACACAAPEGSIAQTPAEAAGRQVLVMLSLPPEHFRPDSGYTGGYAGGPANAQDTVGHTSRRAEAEQLARKHGLTLVGSWPMGVLGVDCYVLQLPTERDAARTPQREAEALAQDGPVLWAQPMNVFRAQGAPAQAAVHAPVPNDPLYPLQPAAQAWRLADLHELATGRRVRVAIVDSGVEQAHPDLAGQVLAAENFVDGQPFAAEMHGTAVAGIIAAHADNGIGIAGVAPGARLLALRACWQQSMADTLCTSLSLAKALQFALAERAEIVNMSLSGPKDRLLDRLIDVLQARGISVVAAADPHQADGGFPASHPGVLAVTDDAATVRGALLLAPGRDVPTTVPGGAYRLLSGASYAAAHVTGLVALQRELNPGFSSRSQPDLAFRPGGGVDTCATLLRVAGSRTGACAEPQARIPTASAQPQDPKPP